MLHSNKNKNTYLTGKGNLAKLHTVNKDVLKQLNHLISSTIDALDDNQWDEAATREVVEKTLLYMSGKKYKYNVTPQKMGRIIQQKVYHNQRYKEKKGKDKRVQEQLFGWLSK